MSYECDEYSEGATCPRCDGWRALECYCGGDLCVCENYGERDCPLCHGEGEVSNELYERYMERQRQSAKEWTEIRARLEAEKEAD